MVIVRNPTTEELFARDIVSKRHKATGSRYVFDQEVNPILGFSEKHRFLSNFFVSPFCMQGQQFHSSEQAYMFHKCNDPKYTRSILDAETPAKCKERGSRKGMEKAGFQLRLDWEDIKFSVMLRVLQSKFDDPAMWKQLKATGLSYLEETNTWNDEVWGRCNGQGENHLGRLLMCVRTKF